LFAGGGEAAAVGFQPGEAGSGDRVRGVSRIDRGVIFGRWLSR